MIQTIRTPTSSSAGMHPRTAIDLTNPGTASSIFHFPISVSPTNCPILIICTSAPASAAFATTCSATNLLLAYPVFCAHLGPCTRPSLTAVPAGALPATEMEEQKMNRAGLSAETDKEILMRFWTAAMCGVKEGRGRLKFTGQAAWMMCVSFLRSLSTGVLRPRLGRLRSVVGRTWTLDSKSDNSGLERVEQDESTEKRRS